MRNVSACFLFIPVILLSYRASAQSGTGTPLSELAWLLGTWEMNTASGSLYEAWHVANDSTLQGRSYKLKEEKDTVVLETIQVTYRGKKFFYIPTVRDQNNAQPVAFTITTLNDLEFIAENPGHDFPQRIGYNRNGNRLEAWIDGKLKDAYTRRNFSFVRVE